MLNKRIIRCMAALMFAGLVGCQAETEGPQTPKTTGLPMKISKYYWPGEFWKEIAEKKGWFKEAGLNVEHIDVNTDYVGSVEDMVANKIDENGFSLFDLMKFNAKGADLVMVVNADNSFGAEAIVARSGIKSLQDLKGKTVGVGKNSYLEYILGVALDRKGLSLSDVHLENILSENAVEVLSKPTIDAVVTWEPMVTEAIQKHNGRRVFDTSEVPGISPNGMVFHRSFIEERPGDVQAFVNVWHKTTQFIKENPKEAFGIIAQIYKQTPGDVQAFTQVDRILDLRDNLTAFSFGSGFESLHGAVRKMNNFLIEKGITQEQLDSTELLDARFIRNLGRNSGPSVK